MNRMKLGVVLETLGTPLRKALSEAARLAVPGVQIDAAGDIAPDQLTETGRRDFRNLLRSSNLELAALNVPLRRGLDVAENLQQRLDHVRKVMTLAPDLGTRRVVVAFPKVPDDAAAPRALLLRESLLNLGEYGDRIGVRLALEAGLDSGGKVRDYLKGFDSGSLAITYDPANFLLNGFDPLAAITTLGPQLCHVQARDGRTTTVSGVAREVPVGAGDLDWILIVAMLESVEYQGFAVVDRESGETRAADVAAGTRFLRRFMGAG